VSNSELAAAIGHYRASEAVIAAFENNVVQSARSEWKAAVAALPHVRTVNSFVSMKGERTTLSTESEGSVATARRALQDVANGMIFSKSITEDDEDYLATIQEVVVAADKRTILLETLRIDHRIEELAEQSDQLGNAAAWALDEALAIRATDLRDLQTKAELIQETDNWERMGDEILKDIRALAGGGR
jgi:hypothetical protein